MELLGRRGTSSLGTVLSLDMQLLGYTPSLGTVTFLVRHFPWI